MIHKISIRYHYGVDSVGYSRKPIRSYNVIAVIAIAFVLFVIAGNLFLM